MIVKLMLSVGRRMSAAAAMDVVALAVAARSDSAAGGKAARVTGIDFSGDCYSGEWSTYAPAIAAAKAAGLKVTLHVGEKDDEAELAAMLAAGPDRIGHLVFAGAANVARVRAAKIPLELCITSNLLTTDWSVDSHHVREWFAYAAPPSSSPPNGAAETAAAAPSSVLDLVPTLAHPISINTDDRGVFDTSMTRELVLFCAAIAGPGGSSHRGSADAAGDRPVTREEAQALVAVTRQAIRDAFVATENERHATLRALERFCAQPSVAPLLQAAKEE